MKYILLLTSLLTSCNMLSPEPKYSTSIVGKWCRDDLNNTICYEFYSWGKVELEQDILFSDSLGRPTRKNITSSKDHTYTITEEGTMTSTLWNNSYTTIYFSIVKNTLTLEFGSYLFTYSRRY